MENISKSRLSNLELLRIISMILIVSAHYVVHAPEFVDGLIINKHILNFISLGGKIGVNCFILITGFFLIKSEFKIDKIIKTVMEVFTYSVIMFIITIIFTNKKIGTMELLKTFLPIIYSNYWFVTNYVVLYILSPFINKLITNLSESEYKKLVIILFIILSVIPTFTGANFVYSNLIWFIFLYLLSGYIRIYHKNHLKKQSYLYIAISMYLLIFFLSEGILMIAQYIPNLSDNSMFFSELNKVPAVICSFCLFLYFKDVKLNSNKYINKIASATFAIYLLHDNYLFKEYLWKNVFKNSNYYNSKFMILHYVSVVSVIFVIGIIAEEIRNLIMRKPIEKIIEKIKTYQIKYMKGK